MSLKKEKNNFRPVIGSPEPLNLDNKARSPYNFSNSISKSGKEALEEQKSPSPVPGVRK